MSILPPHTRIGLEVTAAVSQGGGIGRYTRELLRALSAADGDTAYRLFYAARAPRHPLPPLGANFATRHLPFHDIWLARAWHRLRLPVPVEAITGRLSLYHAPDFTLPPTLPGTPTLLTVHDLSFVRDPDSAAPGLRTYLNAVVPRSVRRATHILADSQATKDDLQALFGTPAEKITVLYCGVNAEFAPVTDPAQLEAARAWAGVGGAPFVLAVSTLQPRKNFVRLIQAFAQLHHPELHLVIAGGKGWLYEAIFAEVARLGLAARVHFPGFAPEPLLPALYSAAHGLAYPSLYEGFGLPMLEAMACGTPVLAANTSCLPEVAGHAALLVNPLEVEALAHGLERLTADTALRTDLRQRGLTRAAQFTWAEAARHLLTVYRQLL